LDGRGFRQLAIVRQAAVMNVDLLKEK
jgi:hypothetical protein